MTSEEKYFKSGASGYGFPQFMKNLFIHWFKNMNCNNSINNWVGTRNRKMNEATSMHTKSSQFIREWNSTLKSCDQIFDVSEARTLSFPQPGKKKKKKRRKRKLEVYSLRKVKHRVSWMQDAWYSWDQGTTSTFVVAGKHTNAEFSSPLPLPGSQNTTSLIYIPQAEDVKIHLWETFRSMSLKENI